MAFRELNKAWNRKIVGSALDGTPKAVGSNDRVINRGTHSQACILH